ncbi:polysaccharide biosynthesis protein [Atopobacter phocae]|uniref:polysaccharide biosynthesis protein n=1 Tax=Atopobacter phocae TaxID=136492 RepID=UPI0004715DED|nr:polysaccharide biosynthesis protein [Atopobacter phocae]
MNPYRLKKQVKGAAWLTIAALFVKVLSAVYRVPYQNMVGNQGFYIFQQVYPLFGLSQALALNSLPQFLASLFVEEEQLEKRAQVIVATFGLVTILSVALFALFYGGSTYWAQWMGDSQLEPVIKSASWSLLCIPILSVLRGVGQAQLELVPTAVSMVGEQIARVLVILSSALFISGNLYTVNTMAMRGGVMGSGIGIVILMICSIRKKPMMLKILSRLKIDRATYAYIMQRFMKEALVFIGFSLLLISLQAIDALNLLSRLLTSGLSFATATAEKGIYDRAQPIFQMGAIIAISITTAFTPVLRQAHRQSMKSVELNAVEQEQSLLRVVHLISLFATVGLYVVMPQLNIVLFKTNEGIIALRLFCLGLYPFCMALAYQTIQQGRRQFATGLFTLILTGMTKSIGNWLLVPIAQINGAAWSTLISLCVTFILMRHFSNSSFTQWREIRQHIIAVTVMLGVCLSIAYVLPTTHRGQAFIVLMMQLGCGAVIGIEWIYRKKWLKEQEWWLLPMGERFARKGIWPF